MELRAVKKVLFLGDPGIDDSLAIMYGLLHPNIDIVGIVTGYGNVTQEQATSNAAYLMHLAGREDIPIINGAKIPLSGEFVTYYPEIHGKDGLGPIRPPKTVQPNIQPFCEIFEIIKRYKNELIIVDAGRPTSLATAFILGSNMMEYVKEYYIMGGAFLVPGNVTPVAEANFHGDAIAANLVMERAKNVTLLPLNVTSEALITSETVKYITKHADTSFSKLISPIFEYYYKAYKKINPQLTGSPIHDVVTMMAVVNPSFVEYVYRRVEVAVEGIAKGESIADFRSNPDASAMKNWVRIGWELRYKEFLRDFVETMT
ncbi:nucleoside hydrolase [Bacillus manliponensis]|uniref:Nucleoside hydrolase n=1 Tax=Bacillus manliponensis TaxID=574376 RepID=A0A073JX63_9BACI|nr:nucleoside hydrolase [Bacillus manliponensis]KEK18802.1 nucleoside hydrolase [Bacillus manliponensis]